MFPLRHIQMVFDLKTFGEPSQTPEHVTTCIEAMRGWGRIHTTRNFRPSTRWEIGEGELAIAVGGNGEKVAFRVGEEYKITLEMAGEQEYQRNWAFEEKHSAQFLQQLIRKNPLDLWGLKMEPLGDWVDDNIINIIPFPGSAGRYSPTRGELLRWYAFTCEVGMKIDPERAENRKQEILSLGLALKQSYESESREGTVPPHNYKNGSVTISVCDFPKLHRALNYDREKSVPVMQLEP